MTDQAGTSCEQPNTLREAIPGAAAFAMLYLLILGIASAVLLLLAYWRVGVLADVVLQRAGFTIAGGALGGTLMSSRYIVYAVRHSTYDHRRFLWQVATPIWSAVLAGIGLIAVHGGIITMSTSWSSQEPNYTFAVITFSFLVGFASESFTKRLIMAAESLFGERPQMNRSGRNARDQSE